MPVDPCFAAMLADPGNKARPPPGHVSMEKAPTPLWSGSVGPNCTPLRTLRSRPVVASSRSGSIALWPQASPRASDARPEWSAASCCLRRSRKRPRLASRISQTISGPGWKT